MTGNRRVKLKPGLSYRNLWQPDRKATAADTTSVPPKSESTLDDWRRAFAAVIDAIRAFPEARKAANEAVLRLAAERRSGS